MRPRCSSKASTSWPPSPTPKVGAGSIGRAPCSRPGPQLAEQREIQGELHGARVARRDGNGITLELQRVARDLRVEEFAQAPAFVLARLEVDDPALALSDERAVETNVLERGAGADRQSELRASFLVRPQQETPMRVGERARQRG